MEYKLLTDDEKDSLFQTTVRNIEAEHFGTVLAVERARASGDTASLEHHEARLADLEKQHEAILKQAPERT